MLSYHVCCVPGTCMPIFYFDIIVIFGDVNWEAPCSSVLSGLLLFLNPYFQYFYRDLLSAALNICRFLSAGEQLFAPIHRNMNNYSFVCLFIHILYLLFQSIYLQRIKFMSIK